MNWSASVLSTVTSDTEPTIVVNFDSGKYIFNVGENTNRAFLQSRLNWRKTKGLFLTSVGTQRASGLPGLLMTLADGGQTAVNIVGPHGLMHFMAAMRLYAARDTMSVEVSEVAYRSSPEPIFKDANIQLYALVIRPNSDTSPDTSSCSDLKRKRTPSPLSPHKKPSNPFAPIIAPSNDTNDFPPSAIEHPETLDSTSLHGIMEEAEFSPTSLHGEMAEEWRKLVIQSMFTGAKSPPNEDIHQLPGGKKKGKRKHSDNAAENEEKSPRSTSSSKINRIHVGNTQGFRRQLPPFSLEAATNNSKPVVAYVLVGPRVRGKFDAAKASALGLAPGPLRGKLSKGETVKFMVNDGRGKKVERIVRPEDCMGESESPGVILILDTPTPAYIPNLVSGFEGSVFFSRFRSDRPQDRKEYSVRTVFHTCGDGVLEDERYISFMRGFGADVHHVVASREHSADPVTFTSSAFNQLRLNQLDPDIFPIPKFSTDLPKDIKSLAILPENTILMRPGILVNIRPPRSPTLEPLPEGYDNFHAAASSPDMLTLSDHTLARFSQAQTSVDNFSSKRPRLRSGQDVRILSLGTGSAVPSKYRNVSGTLIQIPRSGNILLDAGEGTWGSLLRHFGSDSQSTSSAWQILRDLKCVFISHIHADHHIGLAKLLSARRQLDPPPSKPLYLVSNRPVLLYLHEYSDIEDLGLHDTTGVGVNVISSEALHWKPAFGWASEGSEPWLDLERSRKLVNDMCIALKLENFSTVDVYHRTRCYGAIIKHIQGWSIVYSGDTMPTSNLVYAGKNATLLIHEATMADDQVEMARAKGHSTFGQAIDIGRRMNADNILLTHFSARYPKMPPASDVAPQESQTKEPALALAFDNASITIGNMWKMKFYLPAIEQSFLDTQEEGDEDQDSSAVE